MSRERTLTVWTTNEALAKFDKLAKANGLRRSELARLALKAGVRDLLLNDIIQEPDA